MRNEKLTIGKLATAAGVRSDTVRYYERIGLLPPVRRSAAGYRQYGTDDLRQLRFIRSAQALGFSLREIAELLAQVESNGDRVDVRALAERRLAVIEHDLRELESVRETLRGLIGACRGHGTLDECPIIEAVLGEDHATRGRGRDST